MSTESRILISNKTAEVSDSTYSYGEKSKAAGYNRSSDGLHTAVYIVDSFAGSIKIQGTLELYPGDNDWVDIAGTEIGGDSTISGEQTTYTANFSGNYLWIRAAYNLQNGTIVAFRYNY